MVQETRSCHMLFTKKLMLNIKIYRLNEWGKIHQANTDEKKAGVAILISDTENFRASKVIRDEEGHYIIIQGPIFQENITIVNMYHLTTEH